MADTNTTNETAREIDELRKQSQVDTSAEKSATEESVSESTPTQASADKQVQVQETAGEKVSVKKVQTQTATGKKASTKQVQSQAATVEKTSAKQVQTREATVESDSTNQVEYESDVNPAAQAQDENSAVPEIPRTITYDRPIPQAVPRWLYMAFAIIILLVTAFTVFRTVGNLEQINLYSALDVTENVTALRTETYISVAGFAIVLVAAWFTYVSFFREYRNDIGADGWTEGLLWPNMFFIPALVLLAGFFCLNHLWYPNEFFTDTSATSLNNPLGEALNNSIKWAFICVAGLNLLVSISAMLIPTADLPDRDVSRARTSARSFFAFALSLAAFASVLMAPLGSNKYLEQNASYVATQHATYRIVASESTNYIIACETEDGFVLEKAVIDAGSDGKQNLTIYTGEKLITDASGIMYTTKTFDNVKVEQSLAPNNP